MHCLQLALVLEPQRPFDQAKPFLERLGPFRGGDAVRGRWRLERWCDNRLGLAAKFLDGLLNNVAIR